MKVPAEWWLASGLIITDGAGKETTPRKVELPRAVGTRKLASVVSLSHRRFVVLTPVRWLGERRLPS